MKSKKTATKKVPLSKYVKLEMQFEALKVEANKTESILKSTERENDMIRNLLVDVEKNLRATQEKLSFTNHESFKKEVALDRYARIIDVLIKEKE